MRIPEISVLRSSICEFVKFVSCLGRRRPVRVLFSLAHAEVFYQDLWLPDERARLGTGRAFAHGARLLAGRTRDRSRRCAVEHVQRARHG